MKPKVNTVLGRIDVDIEVGGSFHGRFVIGISLLLLDSPAKCAPFMCAYGSTGDSLK
jgi:hypothetical protein